MIRLHYIKGINEVDTPWFDTKSEQEAFFGNNIVWHDMDAYYPPYFMNTIRLSSEDIPFNSIDGKINYCSLVYSNKTYYYFIDSIDYVTDELVEITIEMDTIQTYMFDMLVSKPTIARMAIKRWGDKGDYINRNYIRENLSTGNMIQKSKVNLIDDNASPSEKLGWLIITASDEIPGLKYESVNTTNQFIKSSHSGLVTYVSSGKLTTYRTNGLYTYVLPYTEEFDKCPFIYVQYGAKEPIKMLNPQNTIETLSLAENVLSIKYVPGRMFLDVVMTRNGHNNMPLLKLTPTTFSFSYKDVGGTSHTATNDWFFFVPFTLNDLTKYYNGFVIDYPNIPESSENEITEYTFTGKYPSLRLTDYFKGYNIQNLAGEEIEANRAVGVPYSSKYVPAMIDETYMRVTEGDTGVTCVAPLHYAKQSYAYIATFSTIDGAIAYYISFGGLDDVGTFGGAIDDPHGTAVINENAMEYTLRTDPWKHYQVTHKGSMITDWISTGAGAVTKVAGVASMAGLASGKSKASDTNRTDYSGMAVTAGSGATDYITGFAQYRKVYTTPGRGRDTKTGRFLPRNTYTYTGGN